MSNPWRQMYDMADQLYMTLKVGTDGKVTGIPNNIKVTFGRLEMSVKPSIVSFVRHEGVLAAIVHVAGDFHLCLMNRERDGELERFLFAFATPAGNAADALSPLVGSPISPATLNAALRPFLAVSATRLGTGKWERFDLGEPVAQIHDKTEGASAP